MFGSALSRWTMLHFGAALGAFILAQILMALGFAFPLRPLFAAGTLVTVHLLTLGWLSVLMLGALHQFVPVITGKGKAAGVSALFSLLAILFGLAAMEAGFLALGGDLPAAALLFLPLGGGLVFCGAAIAAADFARLLWQARPLSLSARFLFCGLLFLFAALGLGITLGLAFAAPRFFPSPAIFGEGLKLHLLAGLFGWFTLTAMGVSYRLLSMFTLAPEERGALGNAVLLASAGGLWAAWLLAFLAALGAPVPGAATAAALIVTGFGFALYLFDMARLYRARRRQKLELNALMAIASLAFLAIALLCALLFSLFGFDERLLGALAYLFLFGWLSGLGLSQLYKIVPFLTWLQRYGPVLGKRPVPRVQDLVDESRDRPWFILYFASVAAAAGFAALGFPLVWRFAVAGQLLATVMILRALWLVRRGLPEGPEMLAAPAAAQGGPRFSSTA